MTGKINFKHRSWLWTPAYCWKKSPTPTSPDIWVADLEDSVSQDMKTTARNCLSTFLDNKGGYKCGIRINALRSTDGMRDLLFLIENKLRPDILALPKLISADEIRIIDNIINQNHIMPIKLLPIIETAEALSCINAIAAASANNIGLILGSADLAAQLRIKIENPFFQHVRQSLVISARMHNILAIDAPCFAIDDEQLLQQHCLTAKAIGMDGCAAVHPAQVSTINLNFAPTTEEIEQAKCIVELAKRSKNVVKQGGKLIGPPMIKHAQYILQQQQVIFGE